MFLMIILWLSNSAGMSQCRDHVFRVLLHQAVHGFDWSHYWWCLLWYIGKERCYLPGFSTIKLIFIPFIVNKYFVGRYFWSLWICCFFIKLFIYSFVYPYQYVLGNFYFIQEFAICCYHFYFDDRIPALLKGPPQLLYLFNMFSSFLEHFLTTFCPKGCSGLIQNQ